MTRAVRRRANEGPRPELRLRAPPPRRAVHRGEAPAAAARAKLKHKAKIKDIYDKGKNAVVVTAITTTDATGEELAYNEFTSFIRGAGGWGGDRGPTSEVNVPPDRKPDAVIEEKTHPNQALLYRLSGDINPLHADPSVRVELRLREAHPPRPLHASASRRAR